MTPDQPYNPDVPDNDANRFAKYIGKRVVFNWGKQLQHGKLVKWDPLYQRATIDLIYQGKKMRLELKVGRTTGFAVMRE